MEPITASILIILGKYALDKGVELGKEVGPQALETAKELALKALDKLREKPTGQVIADAFEEDPETYEKPVAKEVDKAIQEDAAFKAQMEALLVHYDQLAAQFAATKGATHTSIFVQGERNVTTTGDITGATIITGDNSTATNSSP